jgi:hypothetical protein
MEIKDKQALEIVHKLIDLYKNDKDEFYDDKGNDLINELLQVYVNTCYYCFTDFDVGPFTMYHKCNYCDRKQCPSCNLEAIVKYGYSISDKDITVLNSKLCKKCFNKSLSDHDKQEQEIDEFEDWARNNLD